RVTESEAQKECEKGDDRESGRELRPQRGEARADPPLGRADWEIEDGGDLLVRQVGKKRQPERLALRRRKLRESRAQNGPPVAVPRLLARIGSGIRERRQQLLGGFRRGPGTAAPAAQLVRDPEVRDLEDPGPDRTPRGIERGSF